MTSVKAGFAGQGGGLASVISRERGIASQAPLRDLYYGTSQPLTAGTELAAGAAVHPEPRPVRTGRMRRRVAAVPVAWSVRDATVFAAIRFEQQLKGNSGLLLRVYRVRCEPFHSGPLAVIEELRQRARGSRNALIAEYWKPSGVWHLWEVLVPSLVVVEEVTPASELETYVPRWVLYRQDRERARMIAHAP
jgi:hypothetical protein